MNDVLSLPLDRDNLMRRVAREIAMDLYPLDQILENCEVRGIEFDRWKDNPQFLKYLKAFKEEWHSALNTHERTKIKAGIVMEDFMEEAYRDLHNKKMALNHRVELGKLVAKIAGMGEPKFNTAGGSGPAFSLSINIGSNDRVTITPDVSKTINHHTPSDFDNYDPFVSPDTLADE